MCDILLNKLCRGKDVEVCDIDKINMEIWMILTDLFIWKWK